MAAAYDDTPLPAILTDAVWTVEFAFYGADEGAPLPFAPGSLFDLTLAPKGRRRPDASEVHALSSVGGEISFADNIITVSADPGPEGLDIAPGDYLVELRDVTDPDAPEALYVGEAAAAQGLSLRAAEGGGGLMPAGGGGGVQIFRDIDAVRVVRGEAAGSAAQAAASAAAALLAKQDAQALVTEATGLIEGSSVRYDVAQALDAGEKAQARTNIGAAPSASPTFTGSSVFGVAGQNTTTTFLGNVGEYGGLNDGSGLVGIGAPPHSGYGLNVNIGTKDIQDSGEYIGIQSTATITPTAPSVSPGVFGIVTQGRWNGSANSSASGQAYGAQFTGQVDGTASIQNLFGAENVALSLATGGTIVNAHGTWARVRSGASGAITNAYGVMASVSGANITNSYGVFIQQGSGANVYGLKVEDQTLGTSLNYSIWTGAGKIHFGGAIEAAAGVPVTIEATAGLGANPALIVTGGAGAANTYSLQVTGGGIAIDNNQRVLAKDVGGTYRTIFHGDNTDRTVLRSLGSGGVAIANSAGTPVVTVDNSTGALQVRNASAVSNITVREGTGQSGGDALTVVASDGTTPRFSVTPTATVVGGQLRVTTAKTPASAGAAGAAGDICWDTSYVYVCTAANTWKRAALASW